MTFSVILPVGPGEREISRARDVLESLRRHEQGRVSRVALVDDSLALREPILELAKNAGIPVTPFVNPRMGRGCGWGAGLTAGVLGALKLLAEDPGGFVLKLDTDSLVIRPFSDQITELFHSRRGMGMVGSYRRMPHRDRDWVTEREVAPAFEKLTRPFTIWRRTHKPWPRVQCALFPRDRRVRRLILDALIAGYTLSEYAQGGGYALRGETVRQMAAGGYLDHPCDWLPAPTGEDVVVSLLVRRLGWDIQDAVDAGDPFGVGNPTLPFSPQEMREKGFAIVHPVNHKQEWSEEQMRAEFLPR